MLPLGLSVDVYKSGVNHACPVSLPGLFERTKTMKNLQWAWRTVIYNRRKLIVIPPQPFIWSRLVKVQTVSGVTQASDAVGTAGGLSRRGEEGGSGPC